MASFSVEVDGRTVRVSAGSAEEAVRKVHEAGKKTKGSGNIAADLTRAALGQGVAFGFGDEIEAAVRAQFDKRNRKELLADIREDIDSFRSSNPALAYGAELGGAVATGLIPGLGAARLGALASRPLLRAGAVNAATGAAAGAGMSEDDKLSGALGGAVLGGAIGAGSRVALPALTKGAKELIDRGITVTPGQAIGGIGNILEERVSNMAITGPAIAARRRAVNDPLFKEIADRTLQLVGRRLPSQELEPLDVLRAVKTGVSETYDDLAARNPINGYATQALLASAADAFFDGVPDQELVKGVRSALRTATKHLKRPDGEVLRRAFDDVIEENPIRTPAISMTGKELQTFANKMREAARAARKKSDLALADALEDLQEGMIIRGAARGGLTEELAAARAAYREYRIMDRAFYSAGNDIDTSPTINKIVAARKANMQRYGETPLLEETQRIDTATRNTVGNTQPNSGTGGQIALAGIPFLGAVSPVAAVGAGAMQLSGVPYMSPLTTAALRQGILAPGRVGQLLGGRFAGYAQQEQ